MRRTPAHEAGVKLQRVIKKIRRHLFVFVTNRAIQQMAFELKTEKESPAKYNKHEVGQARNNL